MDFSDNLSNLVAETIRLHKNLYSNFQSHGGKIKIQNKCLLTPTKLVDPVPRIIGPARNHVNPQAQDEENSNVNKQRYQSFTWRKRAMIPKSQISAISPYGRLPF